MEGERGAARARGSSVGGLRDYGPRMLRIVLVLALALLLTGCSGPCTLIGCSNQVTFQLGAAGQHFGVNEPVGVRACVGTQCAEETVTDTSGGTSSSTGSALTLVQGTLTFRFVTPVAGAQTVTLELKKSGAVVFTGQRDDVTFVDFSPNGPGCAPACQQATVSL